MSQFEEKPLPAGLMNEYHGPQNTVERTRFHSEHLSEGSKGYSARCDLKTTHFQCNPTQTLRANQTPNIDSPNPPLGES